MIKKIRIELRNNQDYIFKVCYNNDDWSNNWGGFNYRGYFTPDTNIHVDKTTYMKWYKSLK